MIKGVEVLTFSIQTSFTACLPSTDIHQLIWPATEQLTSKLKLNHVSTFWRLTAILLALYSAENSKTASYSFSRLMLSGLGTYISSHMALMALAVSKNGDNGLPSCHSVLNKIDNSGCLPAS